MTSDRQQAAIAESPLRVLHLSNDFYPQVTGGTEIFIHQLIEAQRSRPVPHQVLWASHRTISRATDHAPHVPLTPLQRQLPQVPPISRLGQVERRSAGIPGFLELLVDFRPHVVHLHSLSDRCGLDHVIAARRSSARVVLTVHAPGFTCMQGSLLYHRKRICDGEIREHRCNECRLVNGGVPPLLATLLSAQSGWPLGLEASGRLAHLLTARQLTAAFRRGWLQLVQHLDGLHALADWSRQVLLRNGVPPHKLRLIRTGGPPALPPRRRQPMQDGLLRLVYWGRCAEVKGLHLVIEAIQSLPRQLPIELSFYGPYWSNHYGQAMQRRISADPRFRICGPVPKDQLLPVLQNYDLAVVPSTCLETGPLTVLEAFAAGLPVAGSDLGGIRELLNGSSAGWLLPLQASAWKELFRKLVSEPSLLGPKIPVPRTFTALADDLLDLYCPPTSQEPEP